MDKQLTQKLWEDFPKLYAGKDKAITESLIPFGFECGDGWFNIIYNLSEKISKIAPNCEALQVKEKFGTLRFYITNSSKKVEKLISNAEKLSSVTCEECGDMETAKLRDDKGWWVTLCDKCFKNRK